MCNVIIFNKICVYVVCKYTTVYKISHNVIFIKLKIKALDPKRNLIKSWIYRDFPSIFSYFEACVTNITLKPLQVSKIRNVHNLG